MDTLNMCFLLLIVLLSSFLIWLLAQGRREHHHIQWLSRRYGIPISVVETIYQIEELDQVK